MWLALHGFTGTGLDWDAVLPGHALTPDLHGHGTGPKPRHSYAMEDVVERVLALAPQQFSLVGYSMGGRVALHTALAAPARVRRLVLFGATPGLEDSEEAELRRASDEVLAGRIERDGIEAFADFWEEVPILRSQQRISADILQPLRERRREQSAAGLAGALRAYGTGAMPAVWHRLEELSMQVDLVTGTDDPKFTDIARRMLPRLPNARHIEFDGAGHTAHLEQPERARALLLDT